MTASGTKHGRLLCELVKLNLRNPAVKEHLPFDAVRGRVRDYDTDGLRLDAPIAWI